MPKPHFFTLAALLMMSSWAMAAPLACQSYGIVKDAGIDHVLSEQEIQQEQKNQRVGLRYKVECTYASPSLSEAYAAFLKNSTYGLGKRELPLVKQLPSKNYFKKTMQKGSDPEGLDDIEEEVSVKWLSKNKVRMEIAGMAMNWYQQNIEFERMGQSVKIVSKSYAP